VPLGPVVAAERKGLALDDTTVKGCPFKIPAVWPNAQESVTSLRLFKAWSREWAGIGSQGLRRRMERSWSYIKDFVEENRAQVLVGTQISCDQAADDEDWSWAQSLLKVLGPDRIMGVAIGNELELLYSKKGVTQECVQNLWEKRGLIQQFERRVKDLDSMGFGSVPVTSVFGGLVLAGNPFIEDPSKALVNSFLTEAVAKFGDRFAFSFNFYPYFDPSYALDSGTTDQCRGAMQAALCFGGSCGLPASLRAVRPKMKELTGNSDGLLWVGETGWSDPKADTLDTAMQHCAAWSANSSFATYYSNFLAWDLSIGGEKPPDHVFYFTARDSHNFGYDEYFGLMEGCVSVACKLRSPGYKPPDLPGPPSQQGHRLVSLQWTWAAVGIAVLVGLLSTVVFMKVRRCRQRRQTQLNMPSTGEADPAGDMGAEPEEVVTAPDAGQQRPTRDP